MRLFWLVAIPVAVVMVAVGWPLYRWALAHRDAEGMIGGATLGIGGGLVLGWTLFVVLLVLAFRGTRGVVRLLMKRRAAGRRALRPAH
jgi:hypothetical protein